MPLAAARDPETVGRYELHGEIASGGMATVYLGHPVGSECACPVALKRLHPHLAADRAFRSRFLDEARLASRIRHRNVVPTLDIVLEGDEALLVMEYVHGESLQRLLRAAHHGGAGVPLGVSLAVIIGVLYGLHAAHEAQSEAGAALGIVHCDVSPSNVLVGADGIARVADFGIAQQQDEVRMSAEGPMQGKLAYMAPEQITGGRVDRRADVFSATLVLWEMLTGQRLFAKTDGGSLRVDEVLSRPIDAPGRVVPGIPRLLDAIVLHGLTRNRDQRFATTLEMAQALERLPGIALPATVAAWVESLAGRVLAERAERVQAMEIAQSSSRVQTARPSEPGTDAEGEFFEVEWLVESPEPPTVRRARPLPPVHAPPVGAVRPRPLRLRLRSGEGGPQGVR